MNEFITELLALVPIEMIIHGALLMISWLCIGAVLGFLFMVKRKTTVLGLVIVFAFVALSIFGSVMFQELSFLRPYGVWFAALLFRIQTGFSIFSWFSWKRGLSLGDYYLEKRKK